MQGHRAHALGDRHGVVVEDHDDVGPDLLGVVQPFQRQAAGECAVSHDCHHVPALAAKVPGLGKPEGRRYCGAGVPGAVGVVFALIAPCEPGHSAAPAQSGKPILPAGEQLVSIALMADIPHQFVARGLEDRVQRNGEFHRSQVGGQVAAGARNRIYYHRPEFRGELNAFGRRQTSEVRG